MAKQRSKHQKDLYAVYKTSKKMEVNRKRKLTKLAKESPNNLQIAAALLTIGYRRKTPKTSHWSHQAKNFAKLKKSFKPAFGQVTQKISEKRMTMLCTRAHDGQGNLVWNS